MRRYAKAQRTTTAPRAHREYDQQVALFAWAALYEERVPELRLLFSTLNGVRTSMRQAVKAKKAGMKSGVPDVWLPIAFPSTDPDGWYAGLVIEMKRPKEGKAAAGRMSAEQAAWFVALEEQYWQTETCYTWREAATAIAEYLDSDVLRKSIA